MCSPSRASTCSDVAEHISEGNVPVKQFPTMARVLRVGIWNTAVGMVPVRRLLLTSITCSDWSCALNTSSMLPDRELSFSSNRLSAEHIPREVGIDPDKELVWRLRYCIPVRYPSEVGIDPVREFVERARSCIPVRYPSEVGIDPENELALRARTYIPVRYPSEVGIDPDNELV